jgi:hypothetical protein
MILHIHSGDSLQKLSNIEQNKKNRQRGVTSYQPYTDRRLSKSHYHLKNLNISIKQLCYFLGFKPKVSIL